MDINRKQWNRGHQRLHRLLLANDHQEAIELFMNQHAMVHSATMSKAKLWSFEDEVLQGLTNDQMRCIPAGGEHSVAWVLFHLARIEDITMNLLVAGTPQLFIREGWGQKIKAPILHSANSMDPGAVTALSAQIDIDALRSYRQAVGRRTRQIAKRLKPEQFHQKPEAARLQQVMEEGALLPEAIGVLQYWSKRTVAGLLLMPPTRHNFLHLNEALRIRQKLKRANKA
jgi:hypothetical protein